MRNNLAKIGVSLAVLALAAGLASRSAHAQGFGVVKKSVKLERSLPSVARLPGTKISVKAGSENPGEANLAREMRDTLETELLQDDHQLSPDNAHPEVAIECTITSASVPPPQTVTRKGLSTKGRPVDEQFLEVSGNLRVAYQAKDARTGRPIDSYNVAETYQQEHQAQGRSGSSFSPKSIDGIRSQIPFGRKKGNDASADPDVVQSPDQVQQLMMQRAVKDIASRLVNTTDPVEVLLAGGKALDEADNMAKQGLWSRMAESLETMTPFSKPEDDAYRLYDLGVAYEAMAYGAKDPKAAKKFIEQAAINYGKAVDDNQGEKYFLEPQTRIETAAAHYKLIEERASAPSTPAQPPSPAPTAAPAGPTLGNDDVVKLVKAKFPDSIIIKKIKNSACAFDTGADALVKLKQAGVSEAVIDAMVDKQ